MMILNNSVSKTGLCLLMDNVVSVVKTVILANLIKMNNHYANIVFKTTFTTKKKKNVKVITLEVTTLECI